MGSRPRKVPGAGAPEEGSGAGGGGYPYATRPPGANPDGLVVPREGGPRQVARPASMACRVSTIFWADSSMSITSESIRDTK